MWKKVTGVTDPIIAICSLWPYIESVVPFEGYYLDDANCRLYQAVVGADYCCIKKLSF